jgi:hypothetical protein
MVREIRGAVNDDDVIYLFMDGAGYHKHTEVKDEMKKLNIETVMNVAYRFKYNPCERLWG